MRFITKVDRGDELRREIWLCAATAWLLLPPCMSIATSMACG